MSVGIKCSFLSEDGAVESWVWQGGNWDYTTWNPIGENLREDLNVIIDEIYTYDDSAQTVTWELGSLDGVDGHEIATTGRIRTNYLADVRSIITDNSCLITTFYYDENKKFKNSKAGQWFTKIDNIPNDCLVRVVAKRIDDGNITNIEDLQKVIFVTMPDVSKKKSRINEIEEKQKNLSVSSECVKDTLTDLTQDKINYSTFIQSSIFKNKIKKTEFTIGGISSDTGLEQSRLDRVRTSFLYMVDYVDSKNLYSFVIYFYDESKKYIGFSGLNFISHWSNVKKIPYIRIVGRTNNEDLDIQSANENIIISEFDFKSSISKASLNYDALHTLPINYTIFKDKCVIPDDNTIISVQNINLYHANVNGLLKIVFSMPFIINSGRYGLVFKDDSGNIVGYKRYEVKNIIEDEMVEEILEVPNNADTVYISCPIELSQKFYLKGFHGTNVIEGLFRDVEKTKLNVSSLENDLSVLTKSKVNHLFISDFLDDTKSNSDCIEDCLRFASASKHKTIHFDVPKLTLDRAILLESNTTILLHKCVIKQNNEVFDNVFRSKNISIKSGDTLSDEDLRYVPEDIVFFENIRIIGDNAEIIGPDVNKKHDLGGKPVDMVGDVWGGRTHQVNIACVRNFEMSGIKFSKTRGWCCEFEFVKGAYIHDIVFNTNNVKNGDGLSVRAGCSDFIIKCISGLTGDDAIALNTHVSQSDVYPDGTRFIFPNEFTWKYNNAECIKNERAGDIYNIYISDLTKDGGQYHALILLADMGHQIHDIYIENVMIKSVLPAWTNAVISFYKYKLDKYKKGDISRIRIKDVTNYDTNCKYFFYSVNDVVDVHFLNCTQKNSSTVEMFKLPEDTSGYIFTKCSVDKKKI